MDKLDLIIDNNRFLIFHTITLSYHSIFLIRWCFTDVKHDFGDDKHFRVKKALSGWMTPEKNLVVSVCSDSSGVRTQCFCFLSPFCAWRRNGHQVAQQSECNTGNMRRPTPCWSSLIHAVAIPSPPFSITPSSIGWCHAGVFSASELRWRQDTICT